MLSSLFNPPALADYSDYFKTLLTLSGVLLGLAFTALIFVIQSGFASFKFSRRMFLKQYVVFGRNLLSTLSYLTLIPIGELYFVGHRKFLSGIYYIFTVIFIKTFLDIQKQRGYVHTLFSTRFVPSHYGRIRSYFRYIRNLGWLSVFFILVYLVAFLGYPIAVSFSERHSLILTSKGIFYSTLILLTFCIVQIVNFIPQFFKLSNMEMERAIPEETQVKKESEGSVDYVREKAALRAHLLDRGLLELDNDVEFLDGTISLNFRDHTDHHEAWFNINIAVRNSDVFKVRNAVLDYASRLFGLFRESFVDINVFVLSFHIRLGGEGSTRNVFFRSTRSELNELLLDSGNSRRAILGIKNKLFDEIFRGLDQDEN